MIDEICDRIRHGPRRGDSTIGWIVNSLLWWQLWASMGVLMVSTVGAFALAAFLTRYVEGVPAGFIAGILFVTVLERFDPVFPGTERDGWPP